MTYAARVLAVSGTPQPNQPKVLALSSSSKYVLQKAMQGDVSNIDMVPRILRELDKDLDKAIQDVADSIDQAIKDGRPELVKILLKRIAHLLK